MSEIYYGCEVLRELEMAGHNRKVLARCHCGSEFTALLSNLKRGNTKSCGCWKREYGAIRGHANIRHGMTGTPTHGSWTAMKHRCYAKNSPDYEAYGARGIEVCARWRNSFEAFLADMGERQSGMTLDRINNDGNYEPSNCRWATASQQNRNKRKYSVPSRRKLDPLRENALISDRKLGLSWAVLAAKYDVSTGCARHVVDRAHDRLIRAGKLVLR